MDKKISNAKQAWKMNQVILAMNNEDAYYGSGWLYVWPDGSDYSECLEYFSDDESFKELRTLYHEVFKDYYKDGLYNPEKVGPDALEFANETLRKLKISGEFKETQPKLWTVAGDESTQEAMTEAVKKEPKHLKELISKLNKPVEFEDEVFEPIFNFTLEQRDGQWFLYDSNEQYTINYEEDQMYFYQQVADEFGAKIPDVSDDIFPQLEQAIKADFGDDAYFEWEDSVTMVVVPGMKESEHNHTMKENKLIEAQEKIELTTEIINALYDSNVDFQEAEDEDGKVFLIVYGWDTIKQMQQIIKPDFVPEDEYDTSVIDNLKDVEWGFADEWSRCDECGKVIRTQPDSYSFVPDYWVNDGEILCGDCVRNNHAEEYAQSLINKERLANTILTDDNLEELGFIRIESDFENGWYDRHDSPKEILQAALDKHPNGEFLFSISGQAQFATQFELWAREESLEDEEESIEEKLEPKHREEKNGSYDSYDLGNIGGVRFGATHYIEWLNKKDFYEVKSFHPYDESEYHWATSKNGEDWSINLGRNAVDSIKTEKEDFKKVANKLAELDKSKNIKSRIIHDSLNSKKDESKKLKEEKQLNEMVVDLILDRKDGIEYNPEQFYRDAMQYGEVADEITRALDGGTEADVKKALCKYIKDNKYNPSICDYINSVSWIEQFDESMKKKNRKKKKNESYTDENFEHEQYSVDIYRLGKFVTNIDIVDTYDEAKKIADDAFNKLEDKFSSVNISTIYYEGDAETGMETEVYKGYDDDFIHLTKDEAYDLKPGDELIALKSGQTVYVMNEEIKIHAIWCGASKDSTRGWVFDYTELAFPEQLEEEQNINNELKGIEHKTMTNKNVEEAVNDKEFKLVNQETKTWAEYFSEMDMEDSLTDDISEWNGICQYHADVVLNNKKLFRVNCLLFEGIGAWVEYHVLNESITDIGRKYLEESGLIAHEDNEEIILDIDTPYDEESTVEKMLQPVIDKLGGSKITEDVDSDSNEIMIYQFPSSIENFLPEFERLCDEFELTFLGKGLGMGQKEGDDPDFFVEGPLKDLEALADELEYQLHSDYLSSADEFAYEDILIESKRVYIKEATQKQIDAKRKELYAKEKSAMTDSDKIEYVENSARNMMVSILVYGAKPDDSDESFNKLFEREIKNRYLGNFLKADNFGNPAISKERIKELWNEMVTDFKKAEVGYAGEDSEGVSYNYVRYADESFTKKTIKEAVEKKFAENEANKYVKELTQKFFDEGEYFDIWSSDGAIEAQIEWGDWKHQHLFFKRTVQKFFNDLNIDIDIDSQVTEEDGSDTYSASYKITKI